MQANCVCLSQDDLERILLAHLLTYGVTLELGTGLVGLEQTPDALHATLAKFNDGKPTDEQEEVTVKYLLGTDGARGATRKLLGLTFKGETRDTDGMVWGDVEIDGLTNDYWHVWGKPGASAIMIHPLSPSTSNRRFGIGIIGHNFDLTPLADEEKAKKFITAETGRTDLKFGKFTWLSYFKPKTRMVNKFQEGRAFVAGDAGHVHSPTGAQGMNCSVQDATNISWKLALVLKNIAPSTLLETYNAERLPIIAQMLQATDQFKLYTHFIPKEQPTDGQHSASQPSTKCGSEDADDDDKSGWFRWRNNALEMFGINYRFSSLLLEERDTKPVNKEDVLARAYAGYEGLGTLLAGDRAPEAPGLVLLGKEDGKETSLFRLFKLNLHTVLIFAPEGGAELDIVGVVKKWPAGVVQAFVIAGMESEEGKVAVSGVVPVLADREEHASNAYRVERGVLTIIVVRPDGFIGAIVKDVEGLDRYFAKIFII